MAQQIPLVDYLVLGDSPHLEAHECTSCGARFFDRRNACAHCFGTDFRTVTVPTEGVLKTFTIVAFAAPGVQAPFVAGAAACEGTSVRTNIINVEPDPEHVHTGMKVRLATYSLGTDENGTEAIGFGYEPVGGRGADMSASDEIWILGIHMTKFGKHPDKDVVDLGAEAIRGALADGGASMKDVGILAAGNLMGGGGIGQQLQKQIGQTGIPVYNVSNACATGATALRTAIMAVKAGEVDAGLAVGVEKLAGAGLLGAGGKAKKDDKEWTPSGRVGAVAPVDRPLGAATRPG